MLNLSRAGPLTVIGWGRVGRNNRSPVTQQEVELDFIYMEQCVSKYVMSPLTPITEAMICTGRDGAVACKGDRGGRLVIRSSNAIISDLQIGVVSFGVGWANKKFPGVYADVYHHHEWFVGRIAE